MIPSDLSIALIASLISSIAWVTAAAGIVYVPYLVFTGGPWEFGVLAMIVAASIGAIAAIIERRYWKI